MRKRMITAVLAVLVSLSLVTPSLVFSANNMEGKEIEYTKNYKELTENLFENKDSEKSNSATAEGSSENISDKNCSNDDEENVSSSGSEMQDCDSAEEKDSSESEDKTEQTVTEEITGDQEVGSEKPEEEIFADMIPEEEQVISSENTESGLETPDSDEIDQKYSKNMFGIGIQENQADQAAVIFASDLEKLKNGTLEITDIGDNQANAEWDKSANITEFSMPEMKSFVSGKKELLRTEKKFIGKSIDTWTDMEAGLITEDFCGQEKTGRGGPEFSSGLERLKEVLPEEFSVLLSEKNFDILKTQSHAFEEGERISFYVVPSDGYIVEEVNVRTASGDLEIVNTGLYSYEMDMPAAEAVIDVTAKESEITVAENVEAGLNTGMSLMEAAQKGKISVQKVNADTKMNQEYAFTYAFREGVTNLKSINRYNGTLNTKLHNWFGDENGFTTSYCNTFYGALINDSTYSSPVSALYSNVGEYQGQIVDLKVTAISWGTVNNDHVGLDGTRISPCILFYKDRIAFNTISVGTVRFQFEFYKHDTDIKINPKGHVTMADLDGGQGFRIYDNWGVSGLYIRNGYDHLQASAGTSSGGSTYLELRGKEGIATTNSDPKGWCQVDFNGTFTINWLAQGSWNTSKGPMNAFFISTSQSVGTYEPNPAPEKRVGDSDIPFTKMTEHSSESSGYEITAGKNFDYVISQRILPGNYSKLEVTDMLDSCLHYRSAEVQTSGGQDVTKYFNISCSGNMVKISAKPEFLKTDEAMNDVTYYFRIHVTAKDNNTIAAHNHYRLSSYFIKNNAKRQIVSSVLNDIQSTNDSYVKGTMTGRCSVRKVDGENPTKILTGAEFDLYQWDKEKKKYLFAKKMSYNNENKWYESGILTYTADNLGKYRIVETVAPQGYMGGWQKEINVATLENKTVYDALNTKIKTKYGIVSIVKKDGVTGEIIRVKDGEFKVLQWNMDTGKYEDSLENSKIQFDLERNSYLSTRLSLTEENKGKFQIIETKNPTGYEGKFEKEIVFDPLGDEKQQIEISSVNNPIVPPVGEISVTKLIKEADIVWAHGNPVFRFKVSGTDIKGNQHIYEDYVEFQEDKYTVKDGYAVLTCVFKNIPIGTYRVSELTTLRYEFENVHPETSNVTVSGKSGLVSLDIKHSSAALAFYNKKGVFDRYSHTDVVRNKISIIS